MQLAREIGGVGLVGTVEEYIGLFAFKRPFIDDRSPLFDPRFVRIELIAADEPQKGIAAESDLSDGRLRLSGLGVPFVRIFGFGSEKRATVENHIRKIDNDRKVLVELLRDLRQRKQSQSSALERAEPRHAEPGVGSDSR